MERRSTRERDRDTSRGSSREDDSARRRGSRDDDDRGSRDRDERPGRRGRDEGGSSGFTYRQRSAESVRKRAEASTKDFDSYLKDSIRMFKVNDRDNTIRIVPPTWPEAEHYGLDLHVHYGIGPDEQAYLCLKKMKGEDCPICEERDRARRAGEDEEYVKSLEPTRRTLFYLVDRDNEKEGVQAWAAPFSKIDQAIVKVSIDRKTGDTLPIDDPEEGYDIEFEKTGKGMNTQYVGVAIARRSSPLGDKRWLDFAIENPLPDQLVYFDYDHLAKAFGGGGRHTNRSDKDRDDRDDRDTRRDSRSDRDSGKSSRDDRDDRDSGRRSGGREERSSSREPEHTWESIHAMTGEELDALVEELKLDDIDPNKAEDDEELADWICEDLKISKPRESARRAAPADEDTAPTERLRSMRESRGR